MTYTKGPWRYAGNAIVSETEFSEDPSWENDGIGTPVTVVSLFSAMGGDDTKSDAHLIAASPELLAALQDLLTATQPQHSLAHVFLGEAQEAARAAIAKAKGKTS